MEKSLRNFLVLGLIAACVPAITATTNPVVQGPITKEQHKLNTQLIEAIDAGKVARVKQLLAKGADANTRNQDSAPGLIVAINYCNVQAEKRLSEFEHTSLKQLQIIIAEAMINDRKIKAALDTSIQMCKLLINASADVDANYPKTGTTALMEAALCSIEPICKLLIDAGADVNAKDKRGGTALIWAANRASNSVCELLIASGADVHAKDAKGNTALICAGHEGRKSICKLLIASGANVNAQNDYGQTALIPHSYWIASWVNWPVEALCELFIDAGINVNAQDKDGKTALWTAVTKRNLKACKTLINAGINVNTQDKKGKTAADEALSAFNQIKKYDSKEAKQLQKIYRLLVAHSAKGKESNTQGL